MMTDSNGKPRTEYMRLDDYLDRFHPRNPKSHDIGAIISSITRFGFVEQPTVDENTSYVVAGHGRGAALAMMRDQQMDIPERIEQDSDGMWMLPVTRGISFRDEAHVNAYLVASNRLTILGGWDDTALADMLQELALESDALLEVSGYDGDDLDQLLKDLGVFEEPPPPPEPQIDKAAELQEVWQVQRGDLWQIGKHRLLCGDSRDSSDVARVVANSKIMLAEFDPIFGMSAIEQSQSISNISANTILLWGLDYELYHVVRKLDVKPDMSYVWVFPFGHAYGSLKSTPFCHHRNIYVFRKPSAVYHGNLKYEDGTVSSTVFNNIFMKDHEKPEMIYEKLLLSHTDEDNGVYVAFGGLGNMLVVCQQLNRKCRMIEIEPKYCAVILERLSQMNLTPELIDRIGD